MPCSSNAVFFVYFSTALYFPSLFLVASSSQYNTFLTIIVYCLNGMLLPCSQMSTIEYSPDSIPFHTHSTKVHYNIIFPSSPGYQVGSCSNNVLSFYVVCAPNFNHLSSYPDLSSSCFSRFSK